PFEDVSNEFQDGLDQGLIEPSHCLSCPRGRFQSFCVLPPVVILRQDFSRALIGLFIRIVAWTVRWVVRVSCHYEPTGDERTDGQPAEGRTTEEFQATACQL